METTLLEKNIKVLYITANSFPDGISRPENNKGIVYRAGAEEITEGETEKFNCEALVIKKGKYVSEIINDYKKDVLSIESTFKKLLSQPNLDPQGYCVEWYLNENDVKCMVRLKE